MAKNTHRVPKKQWRKWKNVGQATFNRLWDEIKWDNQSRKKPLDKVARWNACWLAADVAKDIDEEILDGRFNRGIR